MNQRAIPDPSVEIVIGENEDVDSSVEWVLDAGSAAGGHLEVDTQVGPGDFFGFVLNLPLRSIETEEKKTLEVGCTPHDLRALALIFTRLVDTFEAGQFDRTPPRRN